MQDSSRGWMDCHCFICRATYQGTVFNANHWCPVCGRTPWDSFSEAYPTLEYKLKYYGYGKAEKPTIESFRRIA